MGDQMGSVGIFALEIAGTRFACARDFGGGYRLQAGDFTFTMMPDAAGVLAAAGGRIQLRAKVAAKFGREMRAGAVFARNLLSTDGRTARVEIGIADSGDVFLEIDTVRLTLDGQQAQVLLAVLGQLDRDVTTVQRAASEAQGPDLTVAQGLRGWLYPWETDPSW
jgi:hypothetical protein